jgi:shikimate 5-dehydrogenase
MDMCASYLESEVGYVTNEWYAMRLCPAARTIGAVNTLWRRPDGSTFGENSDWLGLFYPLRAAIAQRNQPLGSALILGAGGTARAAMFALVQLGFGNRVYMWNRTASRLHAFVASLTSTPAMCPIACHSWDSVPADLTVVINTVPARADLTVPPHVWATSHPIVMDVSYFPKVTPVMAQAAAHQCTVISGRDMFLIQGLAQFELWTHRARAARTAWVDAAQTFFDDKDAS